MINYQLKPFCLVRTIIFMEKNSLISTLAPFSQLIVFAYAKRKYLFVAKNCILLVKFVSVPNKGGGTSIKCVNLQVSFKIAEKQQLLHTNIFG